MTSYLKTMLAGLRQWITAQKPDWNQNDETAANYIKGRPCYEDDSGKAVPLPAKYLPTIPAKKVSGLAGVATSGNYNDLTDTPTDIVRYATSQSLNEAQKTQARDNIGAVSSSEITGVVRYTAQELTEEEKAQARINIGSVEISDIEKAKDHIALIDQINGYTYLVSMRNGNLVSSVGTKTIDITVMPTKTSYIHGEYFDTTGMIITAICYDGTVKEITDYVYPTAYLTEGTISVEITYTEAGNTMTATVPITVSAFDPEVILVDFEYTDNGDGTYTITGWKGTYNGEASTEIIIPNNGAIRV